MIRHNIYTYPGTDTGSGELFRINTLLASPHSEMEAPGFALGVVTMEPGHGHEIHRHPQNRELCVMLEGELHIYQKRDADILVEKESDGVVLKAGDFFSMDFDEPHGFWNKSDKTARLLWIYHPAGNAEDRFLNKRVTD